MVYVFSDIFERPVENRPEYYLLIKTDNIRNARILSIKHKETGEEALSSVFVKKYSELDDQQSKLLTYELREKFNFKDEDLMYVNRSIAQLGIDRVYDSITPPDIFESVREALKKYEEFIEDRNIDESVIQRDIADIFSKNLHFATPRDKYEEILLYQDGIYQPGAEFFIKELIQKNIKGKYLKNHLRDEVKEHLKPLTYVNREDFDKDPNILVLENCLIDLITLEEMPHSPNYLSIVKLPVKYVKDVDCPNIKKFMSEVMLKDDIPIMQEWFGYNLWKGVEAEKIMVLEGEGWNGKSTLLKLLIALLGKKNVAHRSLQQLEYNQFAKSSLYGKLANIYADLSDQALKTTETFKLVTSGDGVTIEFKRQDGFETNLYVKNTYSCNKLPEIYEDTIAIWRRLNIITFPYSFEGKDNKNLINELTTPEELSGLLNWSLEGLTRLRNNNWAFTDSKTTDNIREDYIRKSAPIKAWEMDCLEPKQLSFYPKKYLYQNHITYCQEHNLPICSETTFFRKIKIVLKDYNLEDTKNNWKGEGRLHCFTGLRLKNDTSQDKVQSSLDI